MKEKNIFDQLEPREELPSSHKTTVMASLELAKLALDFAELFTARRIRTEAEILANFGTENTDGK